VQITPSSLWFIGNISIVFMGFRNQFITFGGHHLVVLGGIMPPHTADLTAVDFATTAVA